MKVNYYHSLVRRLDHKGYAGEREWSENVKEPDIPYKFFTETTWVILNSGMKEQIARMIYNRIMEALEKDIDISTVFGHKGKVKAIKYVFENQHQLLEEYLDAEDKVEYLVTIPFIGNITKYHLAKNFGADVCKPDRHLVRIAGEYDTTPEELCKRLSKESGDRIATVDLILWRAANLKMI